MPEWFTMAIVMNGLLTRLSRDSGKAILTMIDECKHTQYE